VSTGIQIPWDVIAGVIIGLSWAAFANDVLRRHIEPLIEEFFRNKSGDA